ncbi:hypothetical protein KJ365_11630 [Glaciecola sp. XM2]|uniref:hypothetical protein n=1 Tax=Glaciecola sp. XM2 TaxID=1914931 RepID=UPI001BDF299B|nr:hypothetical protein [Glaciecola sp. XM2]MBT1451531.1 hypothetical protein [Glaciecola sp. XM2]
MLLRRVMEHVKTQNWTAVFIDFIIVVVGVFIGIQVSNWNDENGRLAKEQAYLVLIHEELVQNSKTTDNLLNYYSTVTEAGERALLYLEGNTQCQATCEGLLIDFFHASQLWAITLDRTAFDEAVKLSFPTNSALREELFTTYDLINAFGMLNQDSPPFREAVRGYFNPDAARILWTGCWEVDVDAVLETLTRDCESSLVAIDAASMLRNIRADKALAQMLRFWIGQNITAMANYPVLIERTQKTADMVLSEITTSS